MRLSNGSASGSTPPPVAGQVSRRGIYFRALLVGYFEGIDSERGIAWRAADSLAIRRFLGIAVDEDVPDHSTISRTRRLIDVETHRAVFTWVQQRLVASGVLKGATIGDRRHHAGGERGDAGASCGGTPARTTRPI